MEGSGETDRPVYSLQVGFIVFILLFHLVSICFRAFQRKPPSTRSASNRRRYFLWNTIHIDKRKWIYPGQSFKAGLGEVSPYHIAHF